MSVYVYVTQVYAHMTHKPASRQQCRDLCDSGLILHICLRLTAMWPACVVPPVQCVCVCVCVSDVHEQVEASGAH